ncbi:MAG: hypothetical protein ABI614_12955 [Planctomycetota bacterium]
MAAPRERVEGLQGQPAQLLGRGRVEKSARRVQPKWERAVLHAESRRQGEVEAPTVVVRWGPVDRMAAATVDYS